MAMLTVALVATFAAASLWQQWRGVEVETAERARVQSDWILTGALDWARLLLREDARQGTGPNSVDHLAEPWAVPLQEARLSSFLAADPNNNATDNAGEAMEAFLSGQIIDLQSMLNVNNLVVNGKIIPEELQSFQKLFGVLGLPPEQLDAMAENLRFATDMNEASRSSPQAPLVPTRLEQLAWLGLPASTISVLQPYVTVLPSSTGVNFNTASAEVMYATVPSLNMAQAQNLVAARDRAPFRSLADITKLLGQDTAAPAGQVQALWYTNFFEVRSRLRLDKVIVEERAMLRRDGINVEVISRQRGIIDPTALTRVAAQSR
jgi:general secretion pathway protein K